MEFLYEPYFISLIIAFICTAIYYLNERNKLKDEDTKNKKELSPELKSILIFIVSYSIFTGLMYGIKHYLYPKGNITLPEEIIPEISSVLENTENTTSLMDQVKNLLPSLSIPTISLFSESNQVNEEPKKEKRHREEKHQRSIDETLIAGKKRSPIKDKEHFKHMNSKEAKFADHDVEFDLNAFNL